MIRGTISSSITFELCLIDMGEREGNDFQGNECLRWSEK